jgi:branched-chain amino acid transport system substrate-binding protein
VALTAITIANLVVAGCSSDTNPDAGGSAKSGDSVKVALLGVFSGQLSSGYPIVQDVVKAWAKNINDNGGLDGRPVELIVKDTGGPTGTNVSAAKEVINEGVAAILDVDNDVPWVKLADQAGVPVIAQPSIGALVTDGVFPMAASPSAAIMLMLEAAKDFGPKFALGYAAESSVAAQYAAQFDAIAKEVGVSVVVSSRISASQPDYTAFCQSLKDTGADSVFIGHSAAIAKKVADQCFQQGVTIPKIMLGGQTPRDWITDPAYQGSLTTDVVAPFFDDSIPGVADYRKAMKKYLPSLEGTADDNSFALQGWALTQMLEYAVEKGGGATAKDIYAGLYSAKGETLDGLIAPVTYVEGEKTHGNCGFSWLIKDDDFALGPHGAESYCVDAETVKKLDEPLMAALGG